MQNMFVDTPKDAWFSPFVAFVKLNNLMPAGADGRLNPSEGITRIETARFLNAYYHLKVKRAKVEQK